MILKMDCLIDYTKVLYRTVQGLGRHMYMVLEDIHIILLGPIFFKIGLVQVPSALLYSKPCLPRLQVEYAFTLLGRVNLTRVSGSR